MENESRRTQALQRESKVLQRNLPKPTKINEQSFKPIVGKTDYNKVFSIFTLDFLLHYLSYLAKLEKICRDEMWKCN